MRLSEKTYYAIFIFMFATANVFLINRFRDNNELENRSLSQVAEAPSETIAETSAANSYTGFYTEELQTLLAQHFETDFSNPSVLLEVDPNSWTAL